MKYKTIFSTKRSDISDAFSVYYKILIDFDINDIKTKINGPQKLFSNFFSNRQSFTLRKILYFVNNFDIN